MGSISFHPLEGSTLLFEVYLGGQSIGIVWQAGSVWHADPFRMQDPKISEADRDLAAAKLVESLSGVQNSPVSRGT